MKNKIIYLVVTFFTVISSFSQEPCNMVLIPHFSVSRLSNDTVQATWDNSAGEASNGLISAEGEATIKNGTIEVEVIYGIEGFDPYNDDSEDIQRTTGSSALFIGLSKSVTYDFYIRHVCGTRIHWQNLTRLEGENVPPVCNVSNQEKQALLKIYEATDGPNWNNTSKKWLASTPVCDWYGVRVIDNKVVHLSLANNNLKNGIPEELSDLIHLQSLTLGRNSITSLPNSLGELNNLTGIDVSSNQLVTLPASIGNLSNLNHLNARSNRLQNLPSTMANLTKMQYFDLSFNSGLNIPFPDYIKNYTELRKLYIPATGMTGRLPENLGTNLTKLQSVYINACNLEGKLPHFSSTSLSTLSFEGNKFVFEDIKLFHQTYINNINRYRFTPQAKLDEIETVTVGQGGSITLTTSLYNDSANSYQWYRLNNGVEELIPGATNNKLIINNASPSDAGIYYFKVTNSIVTGLTLERNPITVQVGGNSGGGSVDIDLDAIKATPGSSFRPMYTKKYVISAWVKEKRIDGEVRANYTNSQIRLSTIALENGALAAPVIIGNYTPTGDVIEGWQRIESVFEIPIPNGGELNPNNLIIELVNTSDSVKSYFDDIRIFPFHGSMKSFVYDNVTKKLMAELDENNYATFYEYDKEGGLIRVKKETSRGVYTIQETRSSNVKKRN